MYVYRPFFFQLINYRLKKNIDKLVLFLLLRERYGPFTDLRLQ
jgi:hypothetical protein